MARAKKGTRVKRAKKTVRVRSMRVNNPRQPKRKSIDNMAANVAGGEQALRQYVALLKDPCNGPLIGPVGACNGGYITRFEKTVYVAAAAGETCFAFRWTPGALGTDGALNDGLTISGATTDTGALTQRFTNADAPGFTYLSNTATNYRCLAACAQISYIGSEVNRAGMIGSGIGTGARNYTNVNQLYSTSMDRSRVPDQKLDVVWEPSDGDLTYTPVTATAQTLTVRATKNAILLSGVAVPNNTISIRMVVVYQWTPQSDDGMIVPNQVPGTGHTLATVLRVARTVGLHAGMLMKSYATGGLMGVAREVSLNVIPSLRNMR